MLHSLRFNNTPARAPFLRRLPTQATNYLRLTKWLLSTTFGSRPKALLVATLLSALNYAAQAAAIFVIYWYPRKGHGDSGIAIPIIGTNMSLDQPELLWLVVLFSAIAFSASAVLLFASRRIILQIVEDHYGKSVAGLLWVAPRLPD